MGIGSHHKDPQSVTSSLSSFGYYDTLRSATLITVRDPITETALDGLGAIRLPCPALFFATAEKTISSVNRIALIYSTDRSVTNHKVPRSLFQRMISAYQAIISHYGKRYEIEFIAHYIDEFSDFYDRKIIQLPPTLFL